MLINISPSLAASRPTFVYPVAATLLLCFVFGPNLLIGLLSCVVLIFGVNLLWRPSEPQVLLYIFGYQWLQVTTLILIASFRGVAVSELYSGSPALDSAVLLVLLGISILAIGVRLGTGPQKAVYIARAQAVIFSVPPMRWLQLHMIMWGISTISLLLALIIPGLSQGFLALANFKWATFVILTMVTFTRPDASRIAWVIVFLVELVSSFGGYFSSFKFVFVFIILSISAVGVRITLGRAIAGAVTVFLMLFIGIYWTAIKPDYRQFVRGGQEGQVVTVSQVEATKKFFELAAEVDEQKFIDAQENLLTRFAELDIFSAVLVNVPANVSYQRGALWWDAMTRPFMPRILFPNKEIIDESELTRRYTGLQLAGMEQGTQISMGYIADSYIDFSEFGMWGRADAVRLFFRAYLSLLL